MTNADKFKSIFGLYATELWSKSEKEFLEWLNADANLQPNLQLSCNHATDCISRQALMKEFADFVRRSNNSDFAKTPTWNDAVSLVGSMPSAQPDVPDTNVGDMISRQAAIDEVVAWLMDRMSDGKNVKPLTERLKDLPSAQPEQWWIPVTKEQILQAGYDGREVRFHIGGRVFAIRELAQ